MVTRAACKKRILAIAAAACLCAALAAAPAAYAFYYVHDEAHVNESGGTGAIEVSCTVDATAQGQGVWTGLIFVPVGSTAADCASEMLISSANVNGVEALHSYDYATLADYLADKTWTCTVYEAGSQNAGAHATYDAEGTQGDDVALERYDSVVFTVE